MSYEPADGQNDTQEGRLFPYSKIDRCLSKKVQQFKEISRLFFTGQATSNEAEGEKRCHKDQGSVLPKHPPERDETTGRLSGFQQYLNKVIGHMVWAFVVWLHHMYKKFQQCSQHCVFCHTEI